MSRVQNGGATSLLENCHRKVGHTATCNSCHKNSPDRRDPGELIFHLWGTGIMGEARGRANAQLALAQAGSSASQRPKSDTSKVMGCVVALAQGRACVRAHRVPLRVTGTLLQNGAGEAPSGLVCALWRGNVLSHAMNTKISGMSPPKKKAHVTCV